MNDTDLTQTESTARETVAKYCQGDLDSEMELLEMLGLM